MQRLLLLAALSLSALSARATVYYVNSSRPDNTGAGTSWATAKRDVQAAIYSATANGDEVWVKAGTYLPTVDTNGLVPADGTERIFDISFRNIKLYGGFAGSETASGQRNPAANVTILSGDLDSSGTATAGDANTVLRTVGRSAACVIDGFTVTRSAGYYNGTDHYPGAGMYNYNSSATINNCIFTANTDGPGMRNNGGGPIINNCTFTGNTIGGGIYNRNSNLAITNSTISGNTGGGGLYSSYNITGSLTVTNCTISNNTAFYGGGGMYSSGNDVTINVTNCTISGNSTTNGNGGGMCTSNNGYGSLTVTNCTISNNTAFYGGGGIYSYGGNNQITNCIISGNTASARGGGMYSDHTTHTISRCVFSNNTCSGSGASGGGLYNYFCSSSDISTCVFSGNSCSDTALVSGGGVGLNNGGGGIYSYNLSGSDVMLVHSTFYGNVAATGGGIYFENPSFGSKSIRSCILYNNTTYNPTANANKEELRVINGVNGNPSLAVYNSIIRDYSSSATNNYADAGVTSNNGANPGLADVTSPTGPDGIWHTADDGLRIGCSSVAKDAGNFTSSNFDAIGNPRQGSFDIGAYEAQDTSTAAPATLPSVTTAAAGMPAANVTTYYTDCNNMVAGLFPTGPAPVSGSVIAKVYVLDSVPKLAGGQPYVQRSYDITPAANAATATATVTLYFTQAEFTAYNAARGAYPSLPVDATDAANYRSNLRITQKHGSSATGLLNSYSGSSVLITPTIVAYDATAQRWEVVFPVTGFSGFFAHTAQTATPLPLALTNFTARAAGSANLLFWSAVGMEGSAFTIERSTTGSGFADIGTVKSDKGSDYSFADEAPAAISYYRLRILAESGQETYSPVVPVRRGTAGSGNVTLAPQPAAGSLTLTNTDVSLNGSTAVVLDIQGREVARFTLAPSVMLDLSGWAPGLYAMRLASGEVLRLVRQ
jgi:parallel beta-helix repeat protein